MFTKRDCPSSQGDRHGEASVKFTWQQDPFYLICSCLHHSVDLHLVPLVGQAGCPRATRISTVNANSKAGQIISREWLPTILWAVEGASDIWIVKHLFLKETLIVNRFRLAVVFLLVQQYITVLSPRLV
uniref:Uncharacterized protein n=1 Tax=Aegilops tauschii subsp. strangulata TaxID=200361 RepID=A0A453JRP7_AEGTS